MAVVSVSPMVDIMAVNAVESLFHPGLKDPYARDIAARFVDFFVYNETARYPIVRPKNLDERDQSLATPVLLNTLKRRDPDLFTEVPQYADDYIYFNEELLEPAFEAFEVYARTHTKLVRDYILSRSAQWIAPQYTVRLKKNYVFSLERLRNQPNFHLLYETLQVSEDQLVYTFDLVLRYSLYGGMAGSGAHYLSHPLREHISFTGLEVTAAPLPPIPLPLGQSIMKKAAGMNQDDFTAYLHEVRGIIREQKIHQLKPETVNKELARELAIKLQLSATGKNFDTHATALGGAISLIGAVTAAALPTAAGVASIVGGLTSGSLYIASSLWKHTTFPQGVARWARWMVAYDVEKEARLKD